MKKKLLVHTLLYTILPKLPTLASFFILPFITPYLTLNDFGKYGLIMAYYAAFTMFVTLGQNVVLQNAFFEYGKNYNLVWNRSYGIMSIGSIMMSIILAVIFFFLLGQSFNAEFIIVTIMFSLALICSPIDTIAQVFYVMKEKPLPLAIRSILMGILNAIIVLVSIKYFSLGYLGWIIGIAANGLFSLLFYIYPICIKNNIYPSFQFKTKHLKEYLRVGLPLLPHNLAVYIFNTSDRLLLSFFKVNVREIGIYSQGYNLGSNGMILINGLFSALGRTLQEAFRNKTELDRQNLRKLLIVIVFGTTIIFFNCALWMKEIFIFLFRKPELQTGYSVAILIIMGYIYFPLYDFAMYPLFIKKKTHLVAKLSICAAIVNLLGNIVFIPIYGFWAALYSSYVSFIVFGLSGLFFIDIKEDLSWLFRKITQVYIVFVLNGILFTILVWYLKDISWTYKIGISIFSSVFTVSTLLYFKVLKFKTILMKRE